MKYYCPYISYDSVALREESRSMTHSQGVCKKKKSYKSSNCAYINVLFIPIKHAYVSLTSTYVILGPRLAFVRPNLPFDVLTWLISKLIS